MRRIHLDEIESLPALGGALAWKPVRLALGIDAFGINAYRTENVGDLVVDDHADPQEELYVVVGAARGSARTTRSSRRRPGRRSYSRRTSIALRTRRSAGRRCWRSAAPRGGSSPRRGSTGSAPRRSSTLGRLDEARKAIAEGLERHPEAGFHYPRARVAAAEGDTESALEHLRRAVAADPSALEQARNDRLLGALADRLA